MTRVLLLPPDNGGLMEFPPLTGLLELAPLDLEHLPAKLTISLSRKGGQLYRDVWTLIGLHTIGVSVHGGEQALLDARVPTYEFTGLSIV